MIVLLGCEGKPLQQMPIHPETNFLNQKLDFRKGGWSIGENCDKKTYWRENEINLLGDTLELINAQLIVKKLMNGKREVSKEEMILNGQIKLKCNSKIFVGNYY